MIKAEIITDASRYTLELQGFDDLGAATKFVSRQLLNTDEAVFEGEDAVLAIDLVNSKVKSYKVWREVNPLMEQFKHVQPPDLKGPPEGTPYEWDNRVKFLGRTLFVYGLAYEWASRTYYLPLTIDGIPALDAMGADNLAGAMQDLTRDWPGAEIVIPPVALPYQEAVLYLTDFAQLHNADPVRPGEVTARAAGSVLA
jgi:hypothetical protein